MNTSPFNLGLGVQTLDHQLALPNKMGNLWDEGCSSSLLKTVNEINTNNCFPNIRSHYPVLSGTVLHDIVLLIETLHCNATQGGTMHYVGDKGKQLGVINSLVKKVLVPVISTRFLMQKLLAPVNLQSLKVFKEDNHKLLAF